MRACTSYCQQGRAPCPCPAACEVPEKDTTRAVRAVRAAAAITAWFASVAICTALALVWIYGA